MCDTAGGALASRVPGPLSHDRTRSEVAATLIEALEKWNRAVSLTKKTGMELVHGHWNVPRALAGARGTPSTIRGPYDAAPDRRCHVLAARCKDVE